MNREELIAAMQATASAPPEPVKTKSWGTVYVRQMTVAEVEDQTAELGGKADDRPHQMARAACKVICDKEGARLFDPDNEADVELVAKQPWPLLKKLLEVSGSQYGDDAPGN